MKPFFLFVFCFVFKFTEVTLMSLFCGAGATGVSEMISFTFVNLWFISAIIACTTFVCWFNLAQGPIVIQYCYNYWTIAQAWSSNCFLILLKLCVLIHSDMSVAWVVCLKYLNEWFWTQLGTQIFVMTMLKWLFNNGYAISFLLGSGHISFLTCCCKGLSSRNQFHFCQ